MNTHTYTYLNICTCIHIYIYIHTHIHTYIRISASNFTIGASVHTRSIYTYLNIYIYEYTHIYIFKCIHIYTYIHMCIYTHTYIHIYIHRDLTLRSAQGYTLEGVLLFYQVKLKAIHDYPPLRDGVLQVGCEDMCIVNM